MKCRNKPIADKTAGFDGKPVPERKQWDDNPFQDSRVKQVMKGEMRNLNLRRYDGVHGDWETLCRVVTMLGEFYHKGGTQIAFRDGIIYAAMVCISLKQSSTYRDALNCGMNVQQITGVVYLPYLVAWAAICRCKGCTSYDCENLWTDQPIIMEIIGKCFASFDRLDTTCYTDNQLFEMRTTLKQR